MSRALSLLVCVCALLFAGSARAHTSGLSQGEYVVKGATIAAHLVFARTEVTESLARDIAAKTTITGDGAPCPVSLVGSSPTEQDGIAVDLSAACAARPQKVVVHAGFLEVLPASHRHLATIKAEGSEGQQDTAVLARMDVSADVGAPPKSSFLSLLWLGVEHILTGYDHLVFLFGLIVVGGKLRSLVGALTAFTVAHSISLALAVLGVVAPSASFVEPAIALSIAYVGIENLVRARKQAANEDGARGRWMLTFPFGLIHGFGFAGGLVEIGLPRARIPGALLAFNLGVEAGQLAVVALVLPLVIYARRSEVMRGPATRFANAAIVIAGLVWFALRVRSV
jgi:hydrogenase/urease accessory protein HupE